jgi:hypothetical protein
MTNKIISGLLYLIVILLYQLFGSIENATLFLFAAWQVGYWKEYYTKGSSN